MNLELNEEENKLWMRAMKDIAEMFIKLKDRGVGEASFEGKIRIAENDTEIKFRIEEIKKEKNANFLEKLQN